MGVAATQNVVVTAAVTVVESVGAVAPTIAVAVDARMIAARVIVEMIAVVVAVQTTAVVVTAATSAVADAPDRVVVVLDVARRTCAGEWWVPLPADAVLTREAIPKCTTSTQVLRSGK